MKSTHHVNLWTRLTPPPTWQTVFLCFQAPNRQEEKSLSQERLALLKDGGRVFSNCTPGSGLIHSLDPLSNEFPDLLCFNTGSHTIAQADICPRKSLTFQMQHSHPCLYGLPPSLCVSAFGYVSSGKDASH